LLRWEYLGLDDDLETVNQAATAAPAAKKTSAELSR
jgi:hypothetical protein